MIDDDRLGASPFDNNRGEKHIAIIHNYNNVNIVSQGSNAQFTADIHDPIEVILMQYFRGITDEAEKLKIIAIAQKIFARKDKKE